MIKEMVVNAAKKKIMAWVIGSVLPWVLGAIAIVVVIVSIMAPAIKLANKFNEFTNQFGSSFKDSREAVDTMLDTLTDEEIEDMHISKPGLKEILRQEANSIKEDEERVITYLKRTRERKYRRLTSEEKKAYKDRGEDPPSKKPNGYKWVTEDPYPKMNVELNYSEITYPYRLSWQLVYVLALILDQNDEYEKLHNSDSLDGLSEGERISVRKVRELARKLKPTFTFKENINNNWFGVDYNFNELQNDVLNYKTYSFYRGNETVTYKFYPLPALDTVSTFSKKYSFTYRRVSRDNGYTYKIDKIEVEDNSQVFIDAIEDVGLHIEDIEFLVYMMKNDMYQLPDIDKLIYELQEIVDRYKFIKAGDKIFNPDIPMIQGDWTRSDLLSVAMSLQGLDYFWGGKYTAKGSNPDWGKYRKVTSEGVSYTGEFRPLGLDCSGFVEWVYYQMLGRSISNYGGTYSMWQNSYAIKERDLKPGDVGFYKYGGGKHIGMYIGKIDGVDAFIHAGGKTWKDAEHPDGQVIITKQYEYYNGYPPSKFKYFRRFPVSFKGE